MKIKKREKNQIQLKIKKFFNFLSLFFILYFLFLDLTVVLAQEFNNLMVNLVAPTPIIRADLIKIIFTAIQYLLSFLGVVAILILIYGGFLWMTAKGDEEKVRKAKKVLINGLIGLVIILLSYAIVQFVVGPLLKAYLTGEEEGVFIGPAGPAGFPKGANYLVITDRYPKPGETVPKNIKIIITFNQNLKPESVKFARPKTANPKESECSDWNFAVLDPNENFIDGSFIVRGNSLTFIPKGDCPPPLDAFKCEKDEEGNCFLTFKKPNCCSCFNSGNGYKIKLIAYRNRQYVGILGTREGRNKLFKDEIWSFNIANYIDTSAPQVKTNLPQGENVARNIGILVEFTKPIDPSTITLYNPNCVLGSANCNQNNCGTNSCLSYAVDDIDKASVRIYANNTPLAGFFERFSTTALLFRPSQRCGEEGSDLYYCRCFPSLAEIKVELINEGDLAIRDVNCNSLDCSNLKCSWTFKTSDQVDIDPPEVENTDPQNNEEDVDRLLQIKVDFNENMDPTSINEDTFVLQPETPPKSIQTINDVSTFVPFKILESDTLYSPIIYGSPIRKSGCQLDPDSNYGVKDLAGNAMFGNYIWRFKTGWLVNGGQPFIDWVSPSQGPKGECVTIHGYNLGCCSPYQCQTDTEAQKKKIEIEKIGGKKRLVCRLVGTNQFGNASMWNDPDKRYENAEVLLWQEINKREPCGPPPKPSCPGEPYCTSLSCPATCSECKFCSDPDPANCGSCYCLTPAYSPENELIIVVPEKATNRGPNLPGQIKIVPAQ